MHYFDMKRSSRRRGKSVYTTLERGIIRGEGGGGGATI